MVAPALPLLLVQRLQQHHPARMQALDQSPATTPPAPRHHAASPTRFVIRLDRRPVFGQRRASRGSRHSCGCPRHGAPPAAPSTRPRDTACSTARSSAHPPHCATASEVPPALQSRRSFVGRDRSAGAAKLPTGYLGSASFNDIRHSSTSLLCNSHARIV